MNSLLSGMIFPQAVPAESPMAESQRCTANRVTGTDGDGANASVVSRDALMPRWRLVVAQALATLRVVLRWDAEAAG